MSSHTKSSALSAVLASIPEAERPRWEQLADAILAEVGDQLAEDAERAVENAAEEIDFDTPAEEAVEREMRSIDLEERVQEAVEEAGLEDLHELCEETLDAANAAKAQAEAIAARLADVTHGGFLRRLRWLVTGR
jgi:hypothetical protein